MRVALRLAENSQSQTFRRVLPLLEQRGIEFVNWPTALHAGLPIDLWIVQQLCLEDANADGFERLMTEVRGFGSPYILMERLDGANLTGITRRLLCSDCPPEFVWKTSRYSNPDFYNLFHCRWHERLIEESFHAVHPMFQTNSPRQIPNDRLGRIHIPFTFGSYDHCRRILEYGDERAANADRPIDVSFAGTVSYSGGLIERHRKACCEAIRKLAPKYRVEVHEGRPLPHEQYADLLFNSKCVVSPAGCGETAYRDWEAIFAGCQLIKPCFLHILNFPACYAIKPDFSDLPECVECAIEHGCKQHHETTLKLRQLEIGHCSDAEVADRLFADIQVAISSTEVSM